MEGRSKIDRLVDWRVYWGGDLWRQAQSISANQYFKSKALLMSTNSKFLRNRASKLIGKALEPKDEIKAATSPKRKKRQSGTATKNSGLFRDYTYIRLHIKSGKMSRLFSFACFLDQRIYQYKFPQHKQMLCDNDEESTQRQIQEDVMKGYKALQKEVTDSTSSHCDETIESNELS